MAYAQIDYGCGKAQFWGDFTSQTVKRQFTRHANQCFGIRKSIMRTDVLTFEAGAALPEPWAALPGAASVLKHSGDTIVWDADGEKIKSEWD